MEKLSSMNLPRSLILLIKDYLTDRTQSVNVDGYQSEKRLVSCGVPHGFLLGPLIFLIYINDLPIIVFSSLALLFADYLKLIHCTKNGSFHYSPPSQLSGQITYRPRNHGKYTITGGYNFMGGYNGKYPQI